MAVVRMQVADMPGQPRRLTRGAVDVAALARGGAMLASRAAFVRAVDLAWQALLASAACRPAALSMLEHMACCPIQARPGLCFVGTDSLSHACSCARALFCCY